jgi:peptidyl-prolyl cis-trans isomerase SurA
MKKMKGMKSLFFAAMTAATMMIHAQERVLFTMGNTPVTAEEFKAVYNKNREVGQAVDPKSPEEYLDLYINFKLKVNQALAMGMDTTAAFKKEFEGYRQQLAKPYLTDRSNEDQLIAEAYERMKEEVRASHIMIPVGMYDLPEDTLKAWKKANDLKKRIEKGESFETLAKQFSTDTYSAERGGDLGFFTVFNMIYPFESAAYNTPVGGITNPVRTQYGYHVIKVTERRPARGMVQVAHIMFVANDKSTPEQRTAAESRAREVYNQIIAGADFEEMARKFSEDKTSATQGGVLAPFGINTMVPEFEEAAFALNNTGDISQPIQTPYGYHILKLVDKKGIKPFEEVEGEIRRSVARDARASNGQSALLARLKKEYNYKEFPKNLKPILKAADSTLLKGQWTASTLQGKKLTKPVITFADQVFTQQDFLDFVLVTHKGPGKVPNINQEIMREFRLFSDAKLMAYEESQLVKKYPEYKQLLQEYRDGILLFELTDRQVWNRASSDTSGLAAFFEANQSNYVWKRRAAAEIFNFESEALAKKHQKEIAKGATAEKLEKKVNVKNALALHVRGGSFEQGANAAVDQVEWKKGNTGLVPDGNRTLVVRINEVLEPQNKRLEEVRGVVISDYQKYLESNWIEQLKKDYPVVINEAVKAEVIQELSR